MRIQPNILTLDIKVQDKFRERLAQLADGDMKMNCVMLGDSDIDYEISQDMNNARILNTPFDSEGIKFPLIFEGSEKGLEGYVTCFARLVKADGTIQSNYNGPSDDSWVTGQLPPTLASAIDRTSLTFTGDTMGYILFFQTIMLNYFDTTTQLSKRLNEQIKMTVTFSGNETVPLGWEVIKDIGTHSYIKDSVTYLVWNNSLFIGKNSSVNPLANANGLITVTGVDSNLTKYITFNI